MTTKKRYTIPELARETKMSESFWKKRVWLKDIEVERYGRCVRITQEAVEKYLSRRRAA